jgi:hypothetical protein
MAVKRRKSKESRPKGPGFGLPPGRGLSMTLLCSTYYSLKLLQAEPIISDLGLRAGCPKDQVFNDEIKNPLDTHPYQRLL